MVARVVVIVGLAAGAVACLSTPPPVQLDGGADATATVDAADCPVDEDGDGYLHAACPNALPADCADDVAAVHPGAYDACDDGTDQDYLGGDLPAAPRWRSTAPRPPTTR